MSRRAASTLATFRISFEGSDRVERVRAESYRSVPPFVEFIIAAGDGLVVEQRVVATFDGREIALITTVG